MIQHGSLITPLNFFNQLVLNAALIALLQKIGKPVIWMGWSGGGELSQQLVLEHPEMFKAVAGLEGCRQTADIQKVIETLFGLGCR